MAEVEDVLVEEVSAEAEDLVEHWDGETMAVTMAVRGEMTWNLHHKVWEEKQKQQCMTQ